MKISKMYALAAAEIVLGGSFFLHGVFAQESRERTKGDELVGAVNLFIGAKIIGDERRSQMYRDIFGDLKEDLDSLKKSEAPKPPA